MEKYIPELEQNKAEIELAEKVGGAMAEGAVAGYKAVEHGVVAGYKAIEHGAVAGYKAIENAAVSGFAKVTDKFVSAFLVKEGESAEDAKARLAAGRQTRMDADKSNYEKEKMK